MSIKLMNLVWEYSGHSGSTLLVLLALADHANDEGVCWPSIPRIAKRGRLGERHALRILAELEASGELQVIERGGGKGHPNVYRVTPATGFMEEIPPTDTVTPVSGFADERVTPASAKGDVQVPKGDAGVPNPDAHVGGTTIKSNHHLEPPENQRFASQTLWVQILGQLQRQLRKVEFETWLRDTQVVSQTDGELVVGTANSHALAWLQDHAREPAEEAAKKITECPMSVRFVILEKADVPVV